MVPNHMGIDSPWVIEHPDWFIQRWESPFPAYSFYGPDLSTDSRVEIKIDDHYYDQTDAAVAFRLRHYQSGETRYVYHGNDGTTFAWNDTAQLDYSKAAVREHVIQVILHVARDDPRWWGHGRCDGVHLHGLGASHELPDLHRRRGRIDRG